MTLIHLGMIFFGPPYRRNSQIMVTYGEDLLAMEKSRRPDRRALGWAALVKNLER